MNTENIRAHLQNTITQARLHPFKACGWAVFVLLLMGSFGLFGKGRVFGGAVA